MATKRKKPQATTAPAETTYTPPVRRADIDIKGYLASLTSVNCSIGFNNQPDCQNYLLYYEEPNGNTMSQIVDGVNYRQVSAAYPSTPIWVYFGWSPMYINAYYKCRICCWFNDGTYAWSIPFDIKTTL